MNSKALAFLASTLATALVGGTAQAAVIDLFERQYNIDGTVTALSSGTVPVEPLPAGVDESGFSLSSGLGTISVTIGGAGLHSFDFFIDLEIDEATNTFFNESGASSGTPTAGQSWEIDEPGFVFGDIFVNFVASTLDGTNAVPPGLEEDVSMAMGWDFVLAAGESATIDLMLSEVMPGSGFFLSQTDPESDATVYFSGTLGILGIKMPEPSSLVLLLVGLAGLAGLRSRRRA